jgi:hypothetical protein
MAIDRGRQYDLEELYELRRTAQNGYWRDLYDKTIYKIMNESPETRAYREDLIKAVRGNDIRSIKRINWKLRQILADSNGGRDY